jgi:glycerophosphoryl diester phosphodiesterase
MRSPFPFAWRLLWLALAAVLTGCFGLGDSSAPKGEITQVIATSTPFRIIAHRGARSLAPENTILAAQRALELGADGWELDVAMTADQELVVLHDNTLERTSDAAQVFPTRQPWVVETFTLDELRRLDFGSWFLSEDPFGQIAAGAVSPEAQASMVGTPIPTLREALEFTRHSHWWVNVEIKDASGTPADTVIVGRVVALIEELGMGDQVLISSFNHTYLRQVKALQPQLATGVLVNGYVADPLALVSDLEAQAYHPSLKAVLPEQVQTLRQQGYLVYVWTVNEESDLHTLAQAGVNGVFTDFPQRMIAAIK